MGSKSRLNICSLSNWSLIVLLGIFHVVDCIENLLLIGESDENIHTLLVLTSIDSINGLFDLGVDFIGLVELVDADLFLNLLSGAILPGLVGSDVDDDWLSDIIELGLLHRHETGHHGI